MFGAIMRLRAFWAAILATALPAAVWAQNAPGQTGVPSITNPARAVEAALLRSPALRGAGASREAVRGDALQARLRPNPEASVVVENFGGIGGRGDYRGGQQIETTLGVSQRLELGGKRLARIAAAGRTGDVATLDYEAARLDLARDVVTTLADATAAARNVEIEGERARLAAETLRVARGRVDAGKEPLLQVRRAEVARATADIAVERARRDAEVSTRSLAVLLGLPRVDLPPRQAWFEDIGPEPRPPLPVDPLARLGGNPDLVRLDASVAQRRADLSLQRANAVPDVTLQGYVRRFEAGRETAFVAGASIPLPINDRNQGGIARALAEANRADAEAERGRLALAASLLAAERRLDLAWRTVMNLRRTSLPAAEQAARFASRGFAEGKFGFLEVLDAQRSLSDTRTQLNDVLRDYHARHAEVDRLRGRMAGLGTEGNNP